MLPEDKKPSPLWIELVAGHEGISTGRLLTPRGQGRPTPKRWTRERIQELAQKLKAGVPLFSGHNSKGLRKPVGEVVSAEVKEREGKAVVWGKALIRDAVAQEKVRRGELDTCSVEAEVECVRDSGSQEGSWLVSAVRKVTGIALGNSCREKPGFPGATVIACLQESEGAEAPAEKSAGESPTLEQRLAELQARAEAHEKKIQELSQLLGRYQEERKKPSAPTSPGAEELIATPPEKATPPSNPLIPK